MRHPLPAHSTALRGCLQQGRCRRLASRRRRDVRAIFDRQLPTDGANDTVNAAAFRFTNPDGAYVDRHGPALRAIYDLADLDQSVFLIALGQSGHVLSPPHARIDRIVVMGDTGCRLKGASIQDCNDPRAWPFAAVMQRAAC